MAWPHKARHCAVKSSKTSLGTVTFKSVKILLISFSTLSIEDQSISYIATITSSDASPIEVNTAANLLADSAP